MLNVLSLALSITLRALLVVAMGVVSFSHLGPARAQEFPTANPKDLGFSSERLERINAFVDREIQAAIMPGAITVIARNGQIVHSNIAGYQDVDSQSPLQWDSLFRIRSMTKPITGVAGMILVEEGKLRLTDPVSKYIPALADMQVYVSGEGTSLEARPARLPIQVRHLFSHTAGFGYPAMGSGGVFTILQDRNLQVSNFNTLKEFVEDLAEVPLLFEPGAQYQYGVSNDVLGYLIEVVSGQSLGEFMADRIFEPLGMTDTAFWVPDSKLDRFTTTYNRTPDGLMVHDAPLSSPHRNPNIAQSGGGGLISTASDYLRFAQMILNKGEFNGVRILSPAGIGLMTRNHLPPGVHPYPWGQGYGLGIGVETDVGRKGIMGNDGTLHWSGADNSQFWIDPKTGIVGLIMTQARPFNFDYAHDLRNLAYQALVDPSAGVLEP